MNKPPSFTGNDFDRAYTIAAQIVVYMGDKYLPIFKRLHDEKAKIEADLNLTNLALQAIALKVK